MIDLTLESKQEYDKSHYRRAYFLIRKAYELAPHEDGVVAQLVRTLYAQGRHTEMEDVLTKHAPRDKPMSDISRVAWGRLLVAKRDYPRAAEVLLAATNREEYDVEYLTGVAYLFQYET